MVYSAHLGQHLAVAICGFILNLYIKNSSSLSKSVWLSVYIFLHLNVPAAKFHCEKKKMFPWHQHKLLQTITQHNEFFFFYKDEN